jgi:GTP-binding protein
VKGSEDMDIKEASLILSAVSKDHYPESTLPEILLSGRSNVGKSSFINTVLNRKNLAYTSTKPGKTQTLNFFLINHQFYFVDVPGYGYAKVSKKARQEFGEMIEEYLQYREQLRLIVLLVDFRHPPTDDDKLMYDYLRAYHLPTLIVATKYDKVKPSMRKRHENMMKDELKLGEDDLFVTFSAVTKHNLTKIYEILEEVIQ